MKKRNLLAGEATGTVLRSDMQIVIPDDATVLCRRSAGRLAQALTLDGLEPAIVTGQDATARADRPYDTGKRGNDLPRHGGRRGQLQPDRRM